MDRQPSPKVRKYTDTIVEYEKKFKQWETRVDRILKRYQDKGRTDGESGSRFNVLWSNVQTVIPAVFARLPKPEVGRRFKDNDPVGRVASIILERALDFEVEQYPQYRSTLKNVVQDRFLGGRGTAWVRYEPYFSEDPVQITEDGNEANRQILQSECAPVDYVHWKDFGHSIVRTWEEVEVIWRKVYLSRDSLIQRFGDDVGGKVPLDLPKEDIGKEGLSDKADDQAIVYEIWDKSTGKALWLNKGMPDLLDERDDPLGLLNFFPCPKPLYSTLTSCSLEPTPDFALYQDQARELDGLADRIDGLIDALKVRGVYDAATPELARLLSEAGNNTLVPVQNWGAFSEKRGLDGSINLIDLAPIAIALEQAYKAMEQVKQQIYDITGISDIIRGQTNANETATAQQLKGQYASLRLKSMQNEVSLFAQELIQIKAQIMCKLYQGDTLARLAGVDQMSFEDQSLIPQAIQMLTRDPMMTFRIQVASDSMIQMDEDQEKQDRIEFLTSAGTFIEKAGQAVQAEPKITGLVMDMLKFGISAFKVGRTMEGEFDRVADEMKASAAQPQAQKQDPEMMKAQVAQEEAQGKLQVEQMKIQQEGQSSQQRLQMEQQRDMTATQAKAQTDQMKLEQEAILARQQQEHEMRMEQMRLEFERWKVEFEASNKLQVAELTAQTAAMNAQVQMETSEMTGEQQMHKAMMDNETKMETAKMAGDQHEKTAQMTNKSREKMASMNKTEKKNE